MPKATIDLNDDEILVAFTRLEEYEDMPIEVFLEDALTYAHASFKYRVIEVKNG